MNARHIVGNDRLYDDLLRFTDDWARIVWDNEHDFSVKYNKVQFAKSCLSIVNLSANDLASMIGISAWVREGPKVFTPTVEQCEVMEQVDVNVPIADYAQPYPALCVILPPGRYGEFLNVIVHLRTTVDKDGKERPVLIGALNSTMHGNDIATVCSDNHETMEQSIRQYQEDCRNQQEDAHRVMRVAINSCLALVNFGCHADFLLKKQADSDRRLANERDTPRGERARRRLKEAIREVSFNQTVVLHGGMKGSGSRSSHETGREREFGWVRGHWRMQVHGPGNSLRKRILIKPYMVRADKLLVPASETSVEYRA